MDFDVSATGPFWAALRSTPPEKAPRRQELRCPSCWSLDCVPGMPRGWIDHIALAAKRTLYDCRKCGRRIYYLAAD